MSDLDKKLEEIVIAVRYDPDDLPDRLLSTTDGAVEAIKQAFIDDGWFHRGEVVLCEDVTDYIPVTMTGQEWYDRFLTEYQAKENKGTSRPRRHAIEAAKKAAGIE